MIAQSHDRTAVYAARNDALERRKVWVDVKREPVRGYPAARVESDGGDLRVAHPHAGVLCFSLSSQAVLGQYADYHLKQMQSNIQQVGHNLLTVYWSMCRARHFSLSFFSRGKRPIDELILFVTRFVKR